jgi:K+-sensing histidine kinase KdpD
MDIIFIIFLLVALAVGIFASESDSFIFTTATILSTFVALDLFFSVPVWATIVANPLSIIMFVFAYAMAGSVFTTVWRWPEYLRERSSEIKYSYDAWAAKQTDSDSAASKQQFMNSYAYREYTASYNSNKLVNWVLAWPFSLAWELARKPAIWLWDTVYDVLGNLFERVGKYVTAKILRDK